MIPKGKKVKFEDLINDHRAAVASNEVMVFFFKFLFLEFVLTFDMFLF